MGAVDLGAASLAVAVGPVAEALRGGGDERVMEFTKEDHEAVSAAIHEAEKRTCGQIVCVLSHSSSEYAYVPILWATVLALLVPWPLIDFTQWTCAADFPAATRGFHRRRRPVLVDAAAACTRSAADTTRRSALGSA